MDISIAQVGAPWLLLTFTLPTKRASQRVEVWRKLQRYGAVPLGNSGYLLPNNPVTRERITRERAKVDRVACPWLIKKYVDPGAEFYFVSAERVMAESNRLNAIPFDVPGVELGHHGKECSLHLVLPVAA